MFRYTEHSLLLLTLTPERFSWSAFFFKVMLKPTSVEKAYSILFCFVLDPLTNPLLDHKTQQNKAGAFSELSLCCRHPAEHYRFLFIFKWTELHSFVSEETSGLIQILWLEKVCTLWLRLLPSTQRHLPDSHPCRWKWLGCIYEIQ